MTLLYRHQQDPLTGERYVSYRAEETFEVDEIVYNMFANRENRWQRNSLVDLRFVTDDNEYEDADGFIIDALLPEGGRTVKWDEPYRCFYSFGDIDLEAWDDDGDVRYQHNRCYPENSETDVRYPELQESTT